MGMVLCDYGFDVYKMVDLVEDFCKVMVMLMILVVLKEVSVLFLVIVEGVFFICDLVNELVNYFIIIEFVNCLEDMQNIGLIVEVFEEDKFIEFGMGSFLFVG